LVLLQLADEAGERGMPNVLYPVTLATIVPAVLGAGILAWFHGARGDQRFERSELILLTAVGAGWLIALIAILS
jgi:hypothetical protein